MPENNPSIEALQRDHSELRSKMSDQYEIVSEIRSKVDVAIALLQKFSDRQDRSEKRVDHLETEINRQRDRHHEDIKDVRERHDVRVKELRSEFQSTIDGVSKQVSSTNKIIFVASGAVMAVAFALPYAIKYFIGI